MSLAACSRSAAAPPIGDQWRNIDVTAAPVALGVEQAGALRFRGGLVLTSDDYAFGGISGLEVLDDGRVIAVSDNGDWFEAHLVLNEDGALIGLSDVRTALMRGENALPFENKYQGDSEDLAQLPDGRFAVSFEQHQLIRIYDLNRDGPFGAAVPGPRLEGAQRLPNNEGLESITAAANGDIIAGAEGRGTIWRAPLDASTPAPPVAHYPLPFGFALTALDRLPDGDIVALERFYAPVVGGRARITRISEAALTGEGALEPALLAAMAPPLVMDNFEGLSAVRMPNGVTRLYLISDNNFSFRQRTLLYAFDIVE